jgi:DNA-directed RNA polymerase subunit M/transcription elongation factor TFIIS|uniref:TFIIS-type domain-containing protein n=1 Tax=viral metagenome TaxID=1070528 RepID=A0A6C0IQ57_9ZZZZ
MMKITNPTQFRENIQSKIRTFGIDEITSINLEKGMFNFAIKESDKNKIIKKWENPQFVQIYKDRFYSMYTNLKNKELLDKITSNELNPQTVAFMTHQEMNPSHWKILLDKKMKRDSHKFDKKVQASTDMFTCRKCKSKNCTFYELQTRSADEPATIFVTCIDCGKNWRS